MSSRARGSGERRPRVSAMVTGKNVRYVAMTTTETRPVPEGHDEQWGERDDRHRLAGDDPRQEGALRESRMDEERGEGDADDRPEREADGRFAPRVERRVDQIASERGVGATLERRGQGGRDVPDMRQREVARLAEAERREVLDVDARAEDVGVAPRIAEEPLEELPRDRQDDEEHADGEHAAQEAAPGRRPASDDGLGASARGLGDDLGGSGDVDRVGERIGLGDRRGAVRVEGIAIAA